MNQNTFVQGMTVTLIKFNGFLENTAITAIPDKLCFFILSNSWIHLREPFSGLIVCFKL